MRRPGWSASTTGRCTSMAPNEPATYAVRRPSGRSAWSTSRSWPPTRAIRSPSYDGCVLPAPGPGSRLRRLVPGLSNSLRGGSRPRPSNNVALSPPSSVAGCSATASADRTTRPRPTQDRSGEERVEDGEAEGGGDPGRGEGEHPGGHDRAGHAPADGGEAT